ncbi:MAG TPA: hypothetical protein PK201_11560, partial [Accumulibacter sp.]|nr:hypothetical protein [Accumulibacter sp.]
VGGVKPTRASGTAAGVSDLLRIGETPRGLAVTSENENGSRWIIANFALARSIAHRTGAGQRAYSSAAARRQHAN